MPNIKFDMNDVKPLLGSLGLGGGDEPKPEQPPIPFVGPPPPPGPPPPTPAAAGFGPWLADPQNQQKVSEGITPPNTPLMPAPAPIAPPPAPPQMASMNPPLPTSAPSPAEVYQTKMNTDMAANPDQYQHAQLMGRGWGNTLAQGGVAALMGLSGGLRPGGDPLAGVNYIQSLRAHDENLPQANAATYDIRNVKPLRDAAQAAQSAAQLENTQSQSAQRQALGDKASAQADAVGDPTKLKAKQVADAAKLGMSPVYDDKGNLSNYAEDANSPITKSRTLKDGLVQAQVDSTQAQQQLRQAQTDVDKAKNDPKSPAYQLAIKKLQVSQQNASAMMLKAQTSMATYVMHAHGTDMQGNALAGAMVGDDGAPIGSAFQQNVRPTGTERNKADMANSAADQIATMKDIAQKHRDYFGPGFGQSQQFQKWIGSQDPDAQRFLSAQTIAADHLAATFGGRSESALNAIHTALGGFRDNPDAALAAMDQLGKANSRFQQSGTVRTIGSSANGAKPRTLPSAPNAGQPTPKPDYIYVQGKGLVKQ